MTTHSVSMRHVPVGRPDNDRLGQDTDMLKKPLEHDGDLTEHGGKGPQESTKRQ